MKDILYSGLIIIVFAFVAGVEFGHWTCEKKWQAECVNRGVAEYGSVTGEWRWKRDAEVLPE